MSVPWTTTIVDVDARDLDPADPLAGLDLLGEQVGELCDLLLVVVGVRATDPLDLGVGAERLLEPLE